MSQVIRPHAWQFTGRWIGESQEIDRPAHIWEIRQTGRFVSIDNLWEGETSFRKMTGTLIEGEAAFTIIDTYRAVMVDPQHFIIAGWDTIYEGEELVARYDVVFSRPGIAELTAHQVWLEWKKRESAISDE